MWYGKIAWAWRLGVGLCRLITGVTQRYMVHMKRIQE